MTLTLDATSTGSSGSTVTSINLSHTCATMVGGCLFAVIVLKGAGQPRTVSATYNGVSMTKINELSFPSANGCSAAFYLLNPSAGTHDIAFSWTDAAYPIMAGRSYSGVHQGVPVLPGSTTTSTTNSVSVPSLPGDIVMDVIGFNANSGAAATVGSGQTQFLNLTQGGGTVLGAASVEPGASGSVTMDWSLTNNLSIAHIGWSIHYAGNYVAPAISPFMRF